MNAFLAVTISKCSNASKANSSQSDSVTPKHETKYASLAKVTCFYNFCNYFCKCFHVLPTENRFSPNIDKADWITALQQLTWYTCASKKLSNQKIRQQIPAKICKNVRQNFVQVFVIFAPASFADRVENLLLWYLTYCSQKSIINLHCVYSKRRYWRTVPERSRFIIMGYKSSLVSDHCTWNNKSLVFIS